MNLIQTIKERWKAETPDFFKGVIKLATYLGTPATAVLAIASTPNIVVPVIVIKIASWVVIACAAMGVTAKLTKQDTTN